MEHPVGPQLHYTNQNPHKIQSSGGKRKLKKKNIERTQPNTWHFNWRMTIIAMVGTSPLELSHISINRCLCTCFK